MFFYRTVFLRFVKYFGLDELFKRPDEPLALLKKKKKEKKDFKTRLLIDEDLNLKVSIVMSALSVLMWLSVPFAMLDSPSHIFKNTDHQVLYSIAEIMSEYLFIIDLILIVLLFLLIYMSTKLIFEGILRTNVNVSPWVERGTYTIPEKRKKTDDDKDQDRRYYEEYEDLIFNKLYKDQYYTMLHEKDLSDYRRRVNIEQRYQQYRELRNYVFYEREYEIIKNKYLRNAPGGNKDREVTKQTLEDWMIPSYTYRKYRK